MSKKTPLPDRNFYILNDRYVTMRELIPGFAFPHAELDLGCGKGDFAAELARRKPDTAVFAADVKLGRLRKVVRKTRGDEREGNVIFLRVEARHLLTIILPDEFLDRIHILCPDPWPKQKHSGNRLLSSDIMMHIARVLKKGGVFHFSTDDAPYLAAVRKNVSGSGLFEEAGPDAIADVADIRTEFETQWLAQGKTVTHLAWRRKDLII